MTSNCTSLLAMWRCSFLSELWRERSSAGGCSQECAHHLEIVITTQRTLGARQRLLQSGGHSGLELHSLQKKAVNSLRQPFRCKSMQYSWHSSQQ